MEASPRTRLAILGTMSDLHNRPVAYDLLCLQMIVPIFPDLHRDNQVWERDDLSRLHLKCAAAPPLLRRIL
jgi:hypothetical protein